LRKYKAFFITIDYLDNTLGFIELYNSELKIKSNKRLGKEKDKEIIHILQVFINIYLERKKELKL